MRVIIMCKAPVPGKVKTRLSPAYSHKQAADMHRIMAEMVIRKVTRLFDDVQIAADNPTHPFFNSFASPIVAQGAGDLGARMTRLMQQTFEAGADGLMFIGTDSPHMSDSRLLQVALELGRYDVVIGPVEDGGYELIAMRQACPQLFEDISWSTSLVLGETLARIKSAGLSCQTLATGFDIDTPEALQRAIDAGLELPDQNLLR
ncbi:MAG: TIGR04282 family arsenosugar biosynthesis glycosyltransferase [Mariprofundaceae bacterium]